MPRRAPSGCWKGDKTAQTAVSVFMGSFMFAIVGIVCLAAELYSDQGRVLLFVATLVDIAVIASALLRWVNHLNDFGRMSDIIDRIERASLPAARLYRDRPSLGCVPRPLEETETTVMLKVQKSGYVKFVDMNRLQTVASAEDLHVEVLRMPGKYVHEGEALLRLSRPASEKSQKLLREAFSLGESRAFDQDLFYGMIVLGEVASKALSPGINDPGTAIEVLRAGTGFCASSTARRTRKIQTISTVSTRPLSTCMRFTEPSLPRLRAMGRG